MDLPVRKSFSSVKCPSCGSTDNYRVALGNGRVILDCQGDQATTQCGYRLSLPFHNDEMNGTIYKAMPIEFDETKRVVD